MLGLDTTIMEHKLPLIPNAILVRQQLRRMKSEAALKIKEEVEKQIPSMDSQHSAGSQERREGPNGPHRASPKDNFPLPH
ncbi:hypothetical protein CR513_45488, partial [Mucuna pruriens]